MIGFNKSKEENKLSIKRGKASSYYSLFLHTNKALEEYRTNSGMSPQYSSEYQHHYWFTTFRMQVESEILDIHVPIVMYNYPQTTTSASVNFHLEQVEEKSDKLLSLAEEKTKELLSSSFGETITGLLPVDIKLVPLGTLHTHPGKLDSFSGTDYGDNPENPGIVHPISTISEKNTPSVSSIVCHSKGIAKLVHTESCLVNINDNVITYSKGKTASYVRSGTGKEPSPIQSMFFEQEKLPSYEVDSGISYLENEIIKPVIDEWEASKFEIDTSNILKDNVNPAKKSVKKDFNTKSKFNLIDSAEPIFILGNIFYKDETYTEDDIDYMRDELSELNIFDVKRLSLMPSKSVVKIYVDEGFGDTIKRRYKC